jgi:hypothetical protein
MVFEVTGDVKEHPDIKIVKANKNTFIANPFINSYQFFQRPEAIGCYKQNFYAA